MLTFGNDAASLMLRSDELDVFEQALLEPAVDVGELFPDFLQRRQGGAHCFGSFGWPVGQIRHLLAKWHNLGILQGSINDKELTFCAASTVKPRYDGKFGNFLQNMGASSRKLQRGVRQLVAVIKSEENRNI